MSSFMAHRNGTLCTVEEMGFINCNTGPFEGSLAPNLRFTGVDGRAIETPSNMMDAIGIIDQTPHTLSLPSKRHKRTVLCQVRGCCANLTQLEKQYSIRKRVCPHHLTADSVLLDSAVFGDQKFRFCHQCGKLEPLTAFDGAKRSCRSRLLRRRLSQKHCRPSGGQLDSDDVSHYESESEDYEPSYVYRRRRKCDTERDSDGLKAKRSKSKAAQHKQLGLSAADWSFQAEQDVCGSVHVKMLGSAAHQQRQQAGGSIATTESKVEQFPCIDEVTGPHAFATGVDAGIRNSSAVAFDQLCTQQKQQPQGCVAVPPTPVIDPSWESMLQAIANGPSSSAADGLDVQLLHQLERELAAEQQPLQKQHGVAVGACQPQGIQAQAAASAAVARPGSMASAHAVPAVSVGSRRSNRSAAHAPSTTTAAQMAAALMSDITSLLEPAEAGTDQPSGQKMELVNKLLDGWCQASSTCPDDMEDDAAEFPEQQLLAQVSSGRSPSPWNASATPTQQQKLLSAAVVTQKATQQQIMGTAADAAIGAARVGGFAPPAAIVSDTPSAAAAGDSHAHSYQMLSPDSAATAVHAPCSAERLAREQKFPVAQPPQCSAGNAQHTGAASHTTMHTSVPAAAAAGVSAPAVTPAQSLAFQRLWLLQRKVNEMSSQLAQLQGVMACQVEELIGMAPAARPYAAATVPPGLMIQPGGLQQQPSGWSNTTTANFAERQMSWTADVAVPNWQQ